MRKSLSAFTVSMVSSLLTLDHTTVFFYTLSLSSLNETHSNNVETWRTKLHNAITVDPGKPRSVASTSTVPGLTAASTRSDSSSKRQHSSASAFEVTSPASKPKAPKRFKPNSSASTKPLAPVFTATVKLQDEDGYREMGGISDHDEMHGMEMEVAKSSPIKNIEQARATASVSATLPYNSIANVSITGPRGCRY